ncbi:MAG: D-alanine--D-alanine ligase [Deltaproteobacteria bacterium]|nr:D-alanine--D-alanine ligase [Deltaproteobacteria bacterium]
MADKPRIAVLLGGNSNEREVSLKSGGAVLKALAEGPYQAEPFDMKYDLGRLVAEAASLDAALVMLHGRGGEDGSLQGLLDLLGLPYQCAGVLGCALAMDKAMAKDRFRQAGLPVARDVLLRAHQAGLPRSLDGLELPVVVKPVHEGSSVGIRIVRRAEDLRPALEEAFRLDQRVLLEEFLAGVEVTAGVLGEPEPQALPLVEILPTEKYTFFDYEAKYTPGATKEICPARLDPATTRQVQELGLAAHQALGLTGYSRTDLIVTANGPKILEVNTIPGMTETSLLPQAAAAMGLDFRELVHALAGIALARGRRLRN